VKLSHGNIWDFITKGYHITVPVNIGWTINSVQPANVMGRGVAKDAKDRFPGCDLWLGSQFVLTATYNHPMGDPEWIKFYPHAPLIFFPTKSLNKNEPWMSWKRKSDPGMISAHLDHFPKLVTEHNLGKVALPLLGAGNGGLDPGDMKKLIQEKLGSDNRFLLITPTDL